MSDMKTETRTQVAGPDTVRLERLLPGPIERVWAYVTESEKRRKWFAGGEWDLRVGGKAELIFRHHELSAEKTYPEKYKPMEGGSPTIAEITRCEPPYVVSYHWHDGPGGESDVTFELAPRGAEVLLTVTHSRLGSRGAMLSVSAGWDVHVGILEDNLRGTEPRRFWTTHAKLEAEYDRRMGGVKPAGA